MKLIIDMIYLVHHNKLEELVAELSASLNNIKHEQEFMEVRERIHRSSKFFTLNFISLINIFCSS
jgi:hypothetical protein